MDEIRIDAWMTKEKPDLMPWARYILEQIQKEAAERRKDGEG